MDSRDLAALRRDIWERIDEKKMVGEIYLATGEYDDDLVTVNLKYTVCGLCGGKGTHVNPSIDSHGLSAEDFAEDPDFAEDYFRGVYDQSCNECHGQRVVPTVDPERNPPDVIKRIQEAEEASYRAAQERYHEMRMGY